ncbi:methyltransferase family protein [Chloroflexota bacterium]
MNSKSVEVTQPDQKRGVKRWVFTSSIAIVLLAASLFISAGTLLWWQAWVYLFTAAGILVLDYVVLVPISPDLLGERSRYQKGAKAWDQLLSRLMATIGPVLILIVSGLDFRNSWSDDFPAWLIVLSMELVLLGGLLALWAMAANRFFIGMVRIQDERGHHVIKSGPYRYVRHPGYLGSLFYILFTPLALASYWALVPAVLTMGVIILRTYLEDKTLSEELAGYEEYTRQVHSRLIPAIW